MPVAAASSRRNSNYLVLVITVSVVGLIVVLAAIVFLIMLARPRFPAPFGADEPRVEFVVAVKTDGVQPRPARAESVREQVIDGVQEAIARRLREMAGTKWNVSRQPAGVDGDLLVQVAPRPELDLDRVRALIATPGVFELKLVERPPALSREALLSGGMPPLTQLVSGAPAADTSARPTYYLVSTIAVVTAADIADAYPSVDERGEPAITFKLNKDGAARMRKATELNVGRQLAIIFDGVVQSAPIIDGPIGQDGRITGRFTRAEAADLALLLRSRSLPAPVRIVSERSVKQRRRP